ncbi:hypothetical protein HW555_014101 [Spodoptera exigua]|uniref:Tr-type G domain-containing protein n=1 Tax=Spodoptera exigua TaxID=7107 RepID=A0A835KZ67_SPOEX|nr:hypothetical protein HW555_014101 [Spodoptera exigua]
MGFGAFFAFLYKRYGGNSIYGNNLVINKANGGEDNIPLRLVPLTLFSTIASHLFGASVGREGTAVQMGGAVTNEIGRIFRLNKVEREIVIICGISAGFSSVFGTPLAGAGFQGGEVTPLFEIGATLGSSLALLLHISIPFLAGLGFIGVFSGATNTPIACFIMGIELFGSEAALSGVMKDYQYPLDLDWTTNEMVVVTNMWTAVEKVYESGLEITAFLKTYKQFKEVVKSIGEEKRLGNEFERVSGEDIRNVAIIAHVDHGKTTLVDELLKQSQTLDGHTQLQERAMDSNAIESERGITILAKNTAVEYNGTRINILDTPGHADFGGEVERIMKMVDGVVLVVDAYEGTMPQTRFVLKKALEQKVTPIVVVNKIDKPSARPEHVVDEVLELFIELGADDDQLDFPVVYASALNGTSSDSDNPEDQEPTMAPIFDQIIEHVPAPVDNSDEPLQFQVSLLDYNDYVGRIGIGRVFRGTMKVGDQVALMKLDGSVKNFRVTKIFGFFGLQRVEITEAKAGDLIAVSGMEDIFVGETVADVNHQEALPILHIDEPTLQMTFLVNNSPFAGREGKFVTARKIEERLMAELQTDVSLRVEPIAPDAWTVSGRGELHLSILIENMRREGYELQVSRPEVIEREIEGVKCEPFERVQIDTPEEYMGSVIESLSLRKGEMQDMIHTAPARGLIGYTTEFLSMTRGYGIMHHTFDQYLPMIQGTIGGRHQGALVSIDTGKATTYSIMSIEERGTVFVEPTTEVYEGMIIGENNRDNDLTVNITKAKQMTNVRSATKDQTSVIKKPKKLTLEESLEFLNEDEYCEVTPESIRLRKQILNKNEREKANFKGEIGKEVINSEK